jgi:hypothetical protein
MYSEDFEDVSRERASTRTQSIDLPPPQPFGLKRKP